MMGAFRMVLCKFVVLADIEKVQNLTPIEPGLSLRHRTFLDPCSCRIHQLEKTRIMFHPPSPPCPASKQGCLFDPRPAKGGGNRLVAQHRQSYLASGDLE